MPAVKKRNLWLDCGCWRTSAVRESGARILHQQALITKEIKHVLNKKMFSPACEDGDDYLKKKKGIVEKIMERWKRLLRPLLEMARSKGVPCERREPQPATFPRFERKGKNRPGVLLALSLYPILFTFSFFFVLSIPIVYLYLR